MSKKHSKLAIRQKAFEHNNRYFLNQKQAVAFRLDFKAFHTFTRGLNKPYDDKLIEAINYAALKLAEEIEGLGCPLYLQSDECSGILLDVKADYTQAWFGYSLQKLQSVMASIFSVNFNLKFKELFKDDEKHKNKIAYCDCRAWNIPYTQIQDYYEFRQIDTIKNATSMVARCHYSDKQLFQKTTKNIQEMLLTEKSIDVNNPDHIPRYFERGRCIYQVSKEVPNTYRTQYPNQPDTIIRSEFIIDNNIPVFKDDKNFIEKYFKNYFTEEDCEIVYGVLEKLDTEFKMYFENIDSIMEAHPQLKRENLEAPFLVHCNELYSLQEQQKTKILKELELLLKIRYSEYDIEGVNDDKIKEYGYVVVKK